MWKLAIVVLLMSHWMEALPHQSLVLVSSSNRGFSRSIRSTTYVKPIIYALNVRTDIRSRYARTLVTSRIANPADHAQEVTFQVTIPETAFVSKFFMEVNGKIMEGLVKERLKAKQKYLEAIQSGHSAGHVATLSVRDANNIRISVNVEAHAKATFNLTYEELLIRRKGLYELAINLYPNQVVEEMSVNVHIRETTNIDILQVPKFRVTNEITLNETQSVNEDAVISWVPGQRDAHVSFAPTIETQRGASKVGIRGQFIVQYDVERTPGAGEIIAMDGYFVHFFAPPELPPLSKHVVFVLDVSGSMQGHKIQQLKEAMGVILRELQLEDYFNIIKFSNFADVLDIESVMDHTTFSNDELKAFPANDHFIRKAITAINEMSASGGTNIYDALRASLDVAVRAVSYEGTRIPLPEPLIIFLTDGEATSGETKPNRILRLLEERGSAPVFSLAFGNDADFGFLKQLSLRAGGFARKIYEASDAALQLRDFYRQVASPLLANVTFHYLNTQVDDLTVTKKKFELYFDGSEIIVAGKLQENNTETINIRIRGEVRALALNGVTSYRLSNTQTPVIDSDSLLPPINTSNPVHKADNFLERLWAFLTVRQLLEKYEAQRGDTTLGNNATTAEAKALELALKFSFVTPVTSLVVVKPDNTSQETAPISSSPEESYNQSPQSGPVSYSHPPQSGSAKNTVQKSGHVGHRQPQSSGRVGHIKPAQSGSVSYRVLPQSVSSQLAGEPANCTQRLDVAGTYQWKCRPLANCVLAEFAENVQRYRLLFKCKAGTDERYLGACCPELPEVLPTPS